MVFRRFQQSKCYVLLVNETSRIAKICKVKTEEGLIHYKNQSWIVETDPLFYKNKAFYIVSDKQQLAFELELEIEKEAKEKEENEEKKQLFIRAQDFTPKALRKVATSKFFEALMAPLYWSREDWIKAIGVGFTFYMILKWVLLSVFKVPLP